MSLLNWKQCFKYLRPMGSRNLSSKDREAQVMLDKLYEEVRAQRFSNVVVIQTKFNADPRYMILASAFNTRHLIKGTELINKQYKIAIKEDSQSYADLSISEGWNVIDFKSVVVHLFSSDCRKHFDIEQLWGVGEKYDDLVNFPSGRSQKQMPETGSEEETQIESSKQH